jgi:UDP-N-acetylmuramate dehydrogenase
MDMAEPRHFPLPRLAGELRLDEPMHRHTTWRAGGVAQRAYFPSDLQDLARFMRTLPATEPVHFVGLGSNLLVRDGGVRGTIVFTHGALKQVDLSPADGALLVYAQAGVAAPKVSRFAATHGLRGAEFLSGVPGTVGGALAMNAGCYGSETWDIVHMVLTLTRTGEIKRRMPAEFNVSYRHVALKAEDGKDIEPLTPHSSRLTPSVEFFAAAWFHLSTGDGEESRRVIKDLLQRRITSQPLGEPNAGSVFRNPPGDYAARLIESCGLKGFAIGGAMVSRKHSNFIVNTGTATAADIEALMEHVQATVQARCGVLLEREVRIIGERQ